MKYILITILLSVANVLSASEHVKTRIDSVVVLYSDWNLLTVIPTSGYDFDEIARSRYVVTDTKTILKFQEEIESLTPKKNKILDVRCKLYFFSGDSIASIVCLHSGEVFYMGRTFTTSERLLSMINNVIDSYPGSCPIPGEFPLYKKTYITEMEQKRITNLISPYFYNKAENASQEYTIFVGCYADVYGNTVDVKFYRLPDFIDKSLEDKLKDLIIKNLTWDKNPERSLADEIFFSIKIERE
ncbi:MAG: hypothetical protein K2M96_02835 [Prevotella sp.]|nr:hypothetical protein [Prevotella sp.]